MHANRQAFTLVELSIVLVILGLLTGGILAGKSLIRASELRSVIRETDQLRTSAMAFRDKYFYLPGDMPNATSFWASNWSDLNGSTLITNVVTPNGNGDGKLYWSYVAPGDRDGQRFFAHLKQAGLMAGTPVVASNNMFCNPGMNVLQSATGGGYFVDNDNGAYGWGNYISLGKAYIATSNGPCTDILLSPEEMWNLDTKMDDGIPGSGVVRETGAYPGNSCANAGLTAYSLVNTGPRCRLFYVPKW